MIASGHRREARPGNARRHLPAKLDRSNRVIAHVEHQSRRPYLFQQTGDVNLGGSGSGPQAKPPGVAAR